MESVNERLHSVQLDEICVDTVICRNHDCAAGNVSLRLLPEEDP